MSQSGAAPHRWAPLAASRSEQGPSVLSSQGGVCHLVTVLRTGERSSYNAISSLGANKSKGK